MAAALAGPASCPPPPLSSADPSDPMAGPLKDVAPACPSLLVGEKEHEQVAGQTLGRLDLRRRL